jgi:hypothetical protein
MYMANEETLTNQLRQVHASNKIVLQQLWHIRKNFDDHSEEWRDVPIIERSSGLDEKCKQTQDEETIALLRKTFGLSKPIRCPQVGDIVEVDGVLGICTESYMKGWCYVRQADDNAPWLDFIIDEEGLAPCGKKWKIIDHT